MTKEVIKNIVRHVFHFYESNVKDCSWEGITNEACEEIFKALDQEKWIPVSERLPDNSGKYLVSVIDDLYENGDYQSVGVAWFSHIIDHAIVRSEWRRLEMGEKVVAWMPLPKSYEAESEDKK